MPRATTRGSPDAYAHPQPLAPAAAAVTARHVGRRPGFVDQDETRRVEVELAIEPVLARFQDIGAILLGRVTGLFMRDLMTDEKAVRRQDRDAHPGVVQLAA